MAKRKDPVVAEQPKQSGRPVGSKTQKVIVQANPSCCPKCGSTDREPYANTQEYAHPGVENGQPYTHVLRRYTRCKACGQARIDRSYENRTTESD